MSIKLNLRKDNLLRDPIEGPGLLWRGSFTNTEVTELAISQREPCLFKEALDVHEKLIEENNLQNISSLEEALSLSDAVALVQIPGRGSASGFLIGVDLLMTNNHVLRSYQEATRARIRFNYQLDIDGLLEDSEYFSARPDIFFYTNPDLDYSIVSVENQPGYKYGTIPIALNPSIRIGDRVSIIQHPSGQPKQVAMVDNEIMYLDNKIVQYLTDTLPGSSGSPVFNEAWELVALHHSGGWIPEPNSNSTHFRNEGIQIKAILKDLKAEGLA